MKLASTTKPCISSIIACISVMELEVASFLQLLAHEDCSDDSKLHVLPMCGCTSSERGVPFFSRGRRLHGKLDSISSSRYSKDSVIPGNDMEWVKFNALQSAHDIPELLWFHKDKGTGRLLNNMPRFMECFPKSLELGALQQLLPESLSIPASKSQKEDLLCHHITCLRNLFACSVAVLELPFYVCCPLVIGLKSQECLVPDGCKIWVGNLLDWD